MQPTILNRDVEIAEKNWRAWQDVFEHVGRPAQNPLLADIRRLSRFRNEYGINRTIRKGRHDEFRMRLRDPKFPLVVLLDDASGSMLDRQEGLLREEFGTYDGGHGLRSVLSKVASFLAPHTFVAFDKYALKGLNVTLGRPRSRRFDSYTEYLSDLNLLLDGEVGKQVRDICRNRYPTQYASQRDRFHRRVVDVYLMRVGGRWAPSR